MALDSTKLYDSNNDAEYSNDAMNELEREIKETSKRTQNLPFDGSFNPVSNIGKTAGLTTPLTLAQVAVFPIGWAGLIKIGAMSSTAMYNGTKLSASDSGNNSLWILVNTTTNQANLVGFSLAEVYLSIVL